MDNKLHLSLFVIERDENPSFSRRAWNLACGITDAPPAPELTDEEKAEARRKLTSLDEDPFWSRVVLVALCICMAFGVFVTAYFA